MNLETLDTSSLTILQFIASSPWQRAKALEKPTSLTAGPVQKRLKELVEKGLLVRRGIQGTEHKVHPTYEYALHTSISIEKVLKILEDRHSPTIPHIDFSRDNAQSLQPELSAQSEDQYELMAELLEAAINRIAELESRVSLLESRKPPRIKLNRAELFEKLKTNPIGG